MREAIGSIKATIEAMSVRIAERHIDAKQSEAALKETLGHVQTDLSEALTRIMKVEGDLKSITVTVDGMTGPVAQFVSLRQRAVGWGAFLAAGAGVVWYFAGPLYLQIVKKLLP